MPSRLIPPEIMALEGEALNDAVAEHVLGWQRWDTWEDQGRTRPVTKWVVQGRQWPTHTRPWAGDMKYAWQIVQVVRAFWLFSERQAFLLALQEQTTHKVDGTGELVTIAWPDVLWHVAPPTICRAAVAVAKLMGLARRVMKGGADAQAPGPTA